MIFRASAPAADSALGVLGPMLEQNFVTSMIKSDGSFIAFFERPIAAGLGLFTIAVWSVPLLMLLLRRRRLPANAPGGRGP